MRISTSFKATDRTTCEHVAGRRNLRETGDIEKNCWWRRSRNQWREGFALVKRTGSWSSGATEISMLVI